MSVQEMVKSDDDWDLIIAPKRNIWDLRLGELWRYRDLIQLLVWRDFVAYYKQTILGPLWYFIQPILTTIVFTVIFGNIARISTDGTPPFLFYLAGNTIWSYFSSCLTNTSNTFTSNTGMYGKVYFPRLCIPIGIIISNFISFCIRFCVFIAFYIYYLSIGASISLTNWIFVLPVLLIIVAGMGLGLGIIISSLTTKYRDLQQLVSFGVQLLMYATPVIYPLSTVKGIWYYAILVNPMTPVLEFFRMAFLGSGSLNPIYLLYSGIFTAVLLLSGIILFNHIADTFMDTV